MATFKFRLMPRGTGKACGLPVNLALVDLKDVEDAGLDLRKAADVVAAEVKEPVAINIYDTSAVTTTSDALAIEGAITAFASGDSGRVHHETGFVKNKEREVTEDLFDFEPHLRLVHKKFPGRILINGPDEADKLVPLHNATITGRAVNNNSGTELMNAVTMEEMLLPVMGQIELLQGREVVLGLAGGVFSTAIAHVVTEEFNKMQPRMRCKPGDTIHASAEHAPKLKAHLPVMVAPKKVLAKNIVEALEAGMVPMRELPSSPAVLYVAHAMGATILWDEITEEARKELKAINLDPETMRKKPSPNLTGQQVIEQAEEIIPGIEQAEIVKADDITKIITVNV